MFLKINAIQIMLGGALLGAPFLAWAKGPTTDPPLNPLPQGEGTLVLGTACSIFYLAVALFLAWALIDAWLRFARNSASSERTIAQEQDYCEFLDGSDDLQFVPAETVAANPGQARRAEALNADLRLRRQVQLTIQVQQANRPELAQNARLN